ncbi:MAG TPA: Nramp family divalent metal transporter [Planctomycetota bacterium]
MLPPWEKGELPDAPAWSWRRWYLLLGPGLLSAGAAIGGGEWLMGPVNTGRYGGSILWVTTLSILAQVVYNIEISRYTLYTGEPIMNGKFRTFMTPLFWLGIYTVLDAGSLIPYQSISTAVPIAAMAKGAVPDASTSQGTLLAIACAMYVLTAVPLVFAGKIYSFVKALMTLKVVYVFAFLTFLILFYCRWDTWVDVLTGFFKIGSVPVEGGGVKNVFVSLLSGEGLPRVDGAAVAALAAYAAIAGIGGLKNTTISSYTREQGWGMGGQVGAISSMFGKVTLTLSHTGKVFEPTPEAMPRWRRWLRHVTREQLAVWMTGAMIGVALPAMLSVQFLPRGQAGNDWAMAALTAGGVREAVGGALGTLYWYMLMLCSILIFVPNTVSDADGTVRRWVDLAWTAVPRLRSWDPRKVKYLYFWTLIAYVALGVSVLLFLPRPKGLTEIYGCIANFALGFSAFHVLCVNTRLLPPPLRPGLFTRTALFLSGAYFMALSGVTLMTTLRKLGWA